MSKWLIYAPLTLLVLVGCTTTHYRNRADKEVYGVIADKAPSVAGMPSEFSIESEQSDPLKDLELAGLSGAFLGEEGKSEEGALTLSLERALALGVWNSRIYQDEKENLYLEALALTLDRHLYTPIFAARGSAAYNRSTSDINKVPDSALLAQNIPSWMRQTGNLTGTALAQHTTIAGILTELQNAGVAVSPQTITFLQQTGQLAGTPPQLLNAYADMVEAAFTATGVNQPRAEIRNERSLSGETSVGASLLLKSGGQFAIDLTSNFLRFLTGNPDVTTSSALVATFTQPLLRGRGSKVTTERLTQSERNVLYQVRDFTRFRKEFSVRIASSYYQVLQNRDTARNNWRGYQAFESSTARERALAEEGRSTQASLGRIEQAMLANKDRWVNSVRVYKQSLDQFKILLGLPTDAKIALDERELVELRDRGPISFPITAEEATKIAQASRLDLYTSRDRLVDSVRRVHVAANSLQPDLDLVLSGRVDSDPKMDAFDTLDFQRGQWSAGFDLDLPLDRKAERNNYRAALIDAARSERNLELAEDTIKLEMRDAWRRLDQAERNYDIRRVAFDLSERRVEEQIIRQELGLSTALDLVDAQNDLINAQNQLTASLVNHTIARLEFWRDMGILYIKEDGAWEEIADVDQL